MTPLEYLDKFNHPKAIPNFCSFDDGVLKPGRDADLLEFKADLKNADNLTVGNFLASLRAEMKHGNEVRNAPRFFSDFTLKFQHIDYKSDDEEQQTDNGLTPVQFPLYEVDRYFGGIRVAEDSPVPGPPIGDLYDMEIVSINMIVFISTTGGPNSTRIDIKVKEPNTVKKPDVTRKVEEPEEAEEQNKEQQEAHQALEKLGLPEGIISFCHFTKVVGYNTTDNVRQNFYSKINVEKPVVSMLVTSIHDTVAVFHKEIQNLVVNPILFNVMPTNGTTKAVSAKLRYALDFNGVTVTPDKHEIAGISDLFGKSSDEIWATLACREIRSVEMFVERFTVDSKLTLGFNVYVSDVPGDRKPVAMAENPRQDKFDEISEMSMTLGPRVEFDRRDFIGILDGKYADEDSYMKAMILVGNEPLTYTQLFECIVNPRNECKTFRVDLRLDDKELGAVETNVLYTPGDSAAAKSSFPYQFYLRKVSPTGVIDSRTFFDAKEFIDLITSCVPKLANSEVKEIRWYPGSMDDASASIHRFVVYLKPIKEDGEEEQEPCHRKFNKLFNTDPNNKWWESARQSTVGMPAIEKAPILNTRTIRCNKPTLHLINLAIGLHIPLELEGPVLDEKGQYTGSIRYRKAGSKPDTEPYESFHIDVTEGALNTLSESSTATELYFGSIHGGGVIKCYLRTDITEGEAEG